jgi:FkbM family methyltransferase
VVPPGLHRFVRKVAGWYPAKTPAYELNVFFSWLGFDGPAPQWLERSATPELPGMKLDVARRYHRKMFYFLKAYYRAASRSPLGQFLRATLAPGDTYLDIGAHIGFYAFMASRIVGAEGRVFAFEPDPHTLESLAGSNALNGDPLQVVPLALSNREGEETLFRAGPTAHSLVSATATHPLATGEQVSVNVSTLDRWAAAEAADLARIAAIKIDVEGCEAEALEGGLETLRRASCPPLWVEVRGPEGSTRAPNTFAKCVEVLAPLGYQPWRWNDGEPARVEIADVIEREDIVFRTAFTA